MPNPIIIEALETQLRKERDALWHMASLGDVSGYQRKRTGDTEDVVQAYIDAMSAVVAKIEAIKQNIWKEKDNDD